MGSTSIRVTYRPLRIGFLIREGSIDLAVEAAMINTLLWGGQDNPIIPVGDNPEYVKSLIDTFAVDTIFCLDESIDLDKLYGKYSQIRHHEMLGSLGFRKEAWQSRGDHSRCLDILSAMNHIWGERTHAWPVEREGKYAHVVWMKDDPERAVFTLLFGAFPREESVFQEGFRKALHASTIELSSQEPIPDRVLDRWTPIAFTSYRLRHEGHERSGASLYLGRGSDFSDLVTFWNHRAAGWLLFFCDVDNMARWASVTKAYMQQPDPVRAKAGQEQSGVIAYHSGLKDSELDLCRESLDCGARLHVHDLSKHKTKCPDFCVEPRVPFLQEDTVLAVVEKRENGYRLSCPLPSPTFLDPNDRRAMIQECVAMFSPMGEYEYPMHTIKVPFLRGLVEDFGRTMLVDPFKSTMQADSVGRIVCPLQQTINIYPLSYDSLIHSVLRSVGIDAKPSQPGVLAAAILQQLGGLHDMWAFKVRGIRKLVKAFRADESFTRQEAKNHISDRESYRKYKFFIDPDRTRPEHLFDHLLERGLLRPGLEFKCNNCRLANWLPLDRIKETWTCEYCGENQRIASLLSGSTGRWRFRKSGLLGKDNNQEGAIPVLLSVAAFDSLFEYSGMVWTAGLRLTKDAEVNCEVDLCVLQYIRHEQASWSLQSKLEIGIAECKDEGGVITDGDIQNMIAVYRQFDGRTMRPYLIFSKTADTFTPTELERFKALKKDRFQMILLSNLELEALDPYADVATDTSHPIPRTLQEMSWASDTRYLVDGVKNAGALEL